MKLPQSFFARDTLTVARDLLGKRLVRGLDGERLSGFIVETEAYLGEEDSACHASRGCTPRTRVMYGPAGHFYVYLIYGMYHMLNIVTAKEGQPEAVLIRALSPLEGIDRMRLRRGGVARSRVTDGPGKLCQALAIDRTLNGAPVDGEGLWLEDAPEVPEEQVDTSPRIGIGYAREEDQQQHWRFFVRRGDQSTGR
ncbi:MAG TPA: DNA-3-methyladenine glycosylase [Chromatiaceae bacterium]|nr:DNA-3-methyladenine glycosylase [Chromatiaceae bacterium]